MSTLHSLATSFNMNNTSITLDNNESSSSPVIAIPLIGQFWIYVIADGSSVACILIILYYLLFDRTLRSSLQNHAIILVLIIDLIYELTDIPWILHYYRFKEPWISSPLFYKFWAFVDYGFYAAQILCFAWATIERHILIFHDRWLMSKRNCFFIHYLPLIVLPSYALIYYCIGSFFVYCGDLFDYSFASGAVMPCLYGNPSLAKYDLLAHQIAPSLIIVICSLGLLIRVIGQKCRVRHPIQWRRHRKMTIQLLAISGVYLVFASPWALVLLAYECGLPHYVGMDYILYAAFFSYFTVFTFPFVFLFSLPELRVRMNQSFLWLRLRKRAINPEIVADLANADRRAIVPTAN